MIAEKIKSSFGFSTDAVRCTLSSTFDVDQYSLFVGAYPQLRFLRFGFFHLGDDTKDLDLEGCRIEAVAGVSVLGAIGDGDDTIHFTF